MFLEQFDAATEALLSDLGTSTKLSIALDAWSASNHLSFLAINGYYINDEWQLKEKLMDFLPLLGSHTGQSMASEVMGVLERTNTTRRLLALTCDNASNNTTLAQFLELSLKEQDIQWDPKENTIPCLAHIINLVVQDIIHHLKLSAPSEVDDGAPLQRRHVSNIQVQMCVPNSLRKLRAICKAIDRSPQRFERFLATQRDVPALERLTVIRDVKTRWNSTYDMCERAVKLKHYINEWLEAEIALKITTSNSSAADLSAEADSKDLKKLRLSAPEWQHLKAITELLCKFKTATENLSQNQRPQSSFIWLMYNRLFDFLDEMTAELGEDCTSADTPGWPMAVKAAAEKGRAKLQKYYARTSAVQGYLFNCATILDPSQKLTLYEDETWDPQDKRMYRAQFLAYLDRYDAPNARVFSPTIRGTPQRSANKPAWFRKPSLPSRSSATSSSDLSSLADMEDTIGPTRQEGEAYLSTPIVLGGDDFDILSWWKANEVSYPRLAQVAKDTLAVQIAQVGVERVFNISRNVIRDQRHNLAAQTIRQIMILKQSISGEEAAAQLPISQEEVPNAPVDEINDLFVLPGSIGTPDGNASDRCSESEEEDRGEEDGVERDGDEAGPSTPSRRQLPPRKRVRPTPFDELEMNRWNRRRANA